MATRQQQQIEAQQQMLVAKVTPSLESWDIYSGFVPKLTRCCLIFFKWFSGLYWCNIFPDATRILSASHHLSMLTNVHRNAVKYIVVNFKKNTLTRRKGDKAPSIKAFRRHQFVTQWKNPTQRCRRVEVANTLTTHVTIKPNNNSCMLHSRFSLPTTLFLIYT